MLVTYTDIQEALNVDLTDPNGQALATSLIASAVEYAEGLVGYPLEEAEVTEYFSEGLQRFWLNTKAPVSGLTLSQYNSITSAYDAISSSYIRQLGSDVYVTTALPSGFQIVKATYTTGWTAETLPADLKRALIDLVGIKLQEVTNFSSNPDDPTGDGSGITTGALKKVTAVDYTEEYATTGNEAAWKAKAAQLSRTIGDAVPSGILSTFEIYRRPYAL